MRDDEKNRMPYYADGDTVHKRPVHDRVPGSTKITVGFPVCKATEIVGGTGADAIAGLMNIGAAAQLTEAELAVMHALAKALDLFCTLPLQPGPAVSHEDDNEEFGHAIHAAQEKVLARSGRRAFRFQE